MLGFFFLAGSEHISRRGGDQEHCHGGGREKNKLVLWYMDERASRCGDWVTEQEGEEGDEGTGVEKEIKRICRGRTGR